MKPISTSEKMMFNTIRITASNGSCGTGSFFTFNVDNKSIPVIITNQHVINYNPDEKVNLFFHLKGDDGDPTDNLSIEFQSSWIFHSQYDLCFCYAAPLFAIIKERFEKEVFYVNTTEEFIYSKEQLYDLSALEELVMVGYPIGLWDEKNNFPIFRKGYTACHPAIDFNSENIGVVDMACFPGSSGSPIFILNENGFTDKKGNVYLGSQRLVLLGYLFEGPQMSITGEIKVKNIPTSTQKLVADSRIMVNLGYYIKANVLFDFKNIIKSELAKNS